MRKPLMTMSAMVLAGAVAAQDLALDAPGTVGIGDTSGVGWTAPRPKGGAIEIRPAEEGAGRVAYTDAKKNPVWIEAPGAPGDHVLALHFDDEDRVARSLVVETATASLAAEVDAGASMS